MDLFKKNRRYKKYGMQIAGFIWLDISKIFFPWWPICEMDRTKNSRELCPVTADLMRAPDGRVNTSLNNTPHVELLRLYKEHKDKVLEERFLKTTRYYKMHKGWRQMDINRNIRTDEWILNKKVKGLISLYKGIEENGYFYEGSNNNFIAVLGEPLAKKKYGLEREIDGHELFDGGHRLACLYTLGYKNVKALLLK